MFKGLRTAAAITENARASLEPHEVSVYGLADGTSGQTWSEATITWNNAPGNVTTSGTAFSNATFPGTIVKPVDSAIGDQFALFGQSLIDFLNADTDGLVTFMMADASRIVTGSAFGSKESTVVPGQ